MMFEEAVADGGGLTVTARLAFAMCPTPSRTVSCTVKTPVEA